MPWEAWPHKNRVALAQYATPDAERYVSLDVTPADSVGQLRMVQEIYTALLKKGIRYNYEPYHPAVVVQPIRTPGEVLSSIREGTCLDLAVLFAGVCLAKRL